MSQRFGQVYNTVYQGRPTTALSVCVASVQAYKDMNTINGWHS